MLSKRSLLLILVVCVVIGSVGTAFAQQKYYMRLSHAQATNDAFHYTAVKFAELVGEKTNGQARVEVFPSGQLGAIRDTVDGLRLGTIQIVLDTPSRIEVYDTLGSIFNVPYLIRNRDHGERVWNGEIGREIFSELAKKTGIRVVAMSWRGSRQLTVKKPVRTPADLVGLKIRVSPTEMPLNTWKALGASPIPMDFNEVYLALQQGTIDGQENPMTTNFSSSFFEVCDYLVLTEHVKNFGGFMMGRDYYQKLPANIKKAVDEAALEACIYMGDLVDENEAGYIQAFKDAGTTVIEPDLAAFQNKLKNFVKEFYPELEAYVNKIQQFQ